MGLSSDRPPLAVLLVTSALALRSRVVDETRSVCDVAAVVQPSAAIRAVGRFWFDVVVLLGDLAPSIRAGLVVDLWEHRVAMDRILSLDSSDAQFVRRAVQLHLERRSDRPRTMG